MAYTEILKLLGSILRWSIRGFKGEFKDFYDEKFERANFIGGIILLLIIALILLPLISLILN
jgi:uncharacterized membrane protein YesL